MKLLVRKCRQTDSDFFQNRENFVHGRKPIVGVGLAEYDAAAAIHYEHGPFARSRTCSRLPQNTVTSTDFPMWPEIAAHRKVEGANHAFPGRSVHHRIYRDGPTLRVARQHFWTLCLVATQMARTDYLPVKGIEREHLIFLSAMRAQTQWLP